MKSENHNPSVASADLKPTHARYWVIVFAVTLAVICYIDRVCISKAAPNIMRDLGLTEAQMGFGFSAFFWAYALFEIPNGWLGDRFGARFILIRVVLWWSFFTAALGWINGLVSLIVIQALFGAGEAGCFPNLTKAFTAWLPTDERVRAQGFMWLSARWGGAFTPLLATLLLAYMSWRQAFGMIALLGILWAFFFIRWYRDNPREHPSVNAAELEIIPKKPTLSHGPVPWMKFLKSRNVWLLWFQYFFMSYPWVFYISWAPTYLEKTHGMQAQWGAVLAGLPLFLGGIGSFFCGNILPRVAAWTGSILWARRLMACIGLGGASFLWILSYQFSNPVFIMLALGFASFCNDLAMPPSWGACMDIGGKLTGTLSGSMNMVGNFGCAIGSSAVGLILHWTGQSWAMVFYAGAASYFFGLLCWLFIDPVTPLDTEPENLAQA